MKKFTKLFLSCAAVAAVTAAVATSAMAADLTATYNEPAEGAATTTVTIDCASEDTTQTLLIVKGNKPTTINQEDIIQIDQKDEKIADAKVAALEDGTYTVYVGGNGGVVYSGTFTIGAVEVLVGDADGNGRVTATDANKVLSYASGDKAAITAENIIKAAYSDGNTRISATDAVNILKYSAGDKAQQYVGKTIAVPAE